MDSRQTIRHKAFRITLLGTLLLLTSLAAVPSSAAGAEAKDIQLFSPVDGQWVKEAKIGETIEIEIHGFYAERKVDFYFSSDEAEAGDEIDANVTAYKYIGWDITTNQGTLAARYELAIPEELSDGADREYVHPGEYYIYIVYHYNIEIEIAAKITVLPSSSIELSLIEGVVGTEVTIVGEGLHRNQKITVNFDDDHIDIAGGATGTDSEGKFTCTVIIPEGTADKHTITVADQGGNQPKAKFNVQPAVELGTTTASTDQAVKISGTGFAGDKRILVYLNGAKTATLPELLFTDSNGGFTGSFLVPQFPSFFGGFPGKVEAVDQRYNRAEAYLTILPAAASISLEPATSQSLPGYAGMEIITQGTRFNPHTEVNIIYDAGGSQTITLATAKTDENGDFSAIFTIPPSPAGTRTIIITDGTNETTAPFVMESAPPPAPLPRLPASAATTKEKTHFSWGEVSDPSGVTYVLQIGTDSNLTTVLLEKRGITTTEYTLSEDDKLEPTEKDSPYYWRVKAIDGASNESDWAEPNSFFVNVAWGKMPDWAIYTLAGLGILLLASTVFLTYREIKKKRQQKNTPPEIFPTPPPSS